MQDGYIRENSLDPGLDVSGSLSHSQDLDLNNERLKLGIKLSNQSGVNGAITSISSNIVTVVNLSGITEDSVGHFLGINNSVNSANDGYFLIKTYFSPTSVGILNINGVAPDSGPLIWSEHYPYSLEADLNYIRTDRANIKGVNYYNQIPNYISPSTQNSIPANLSNLSNDIQNHDAFRQLIHFVNEGPAQGFLSGAFKEILPPSNPFPTNIIWWQDDSRSYKIVEKIINYNCNKTPSTIIWNMYNSSGFIIASIIDTIAYSGIFETSRTRQIF